MKKGLFLLFIFSIAFLAVACYPHFDRMEEFGPNVQANLLIFFKSDVPPKQIQAFWYNTLMLADGKGGYQMRPGICGIGLSVTVQSHESLTIDMCPDSTEIQREQVTERINASPLIFRVLENVIPAQVKQIE